MTPEGDWLTDTTMQIGRMCPLEANARHIGHFGIRAPLSLLALFTEIGPHSIASNRNMERPATLKGERTDTLDVTDDAALALHFVGWLFCKPSRRINFTAGYGQPAGMPLYSISLPTFGPTILSLVALLLAMINLFTRYIEYPNVLMVMSIALVFYMVYTSMCRMQDVLDIYEEL